MACRWIAFGRRVRQGGGVGASPIVSASMPVAAVIPHGRVAVISGSTSANRRSHQRANHIDLPMGFGVE